MRAIARTVSFSASIPTIVIVGTSGRMIHPIRQDRFDAKSNVVHDVLIKDAPLLPMIEGVFFVQKTQANEALGALFLQFDRSTRAPGEDESAK